MRLSSSPTVLAQAHADRIETLRRKLDGLSCEQIEEYIKTDFDDREAAAQAFTWSDEREVRELYHELPHEEAFAFCLANKTYYAALLNIARLQFENRFQPLRSSSTISLSEFRDELPYDQINEQLLKDFLSQKPGYKRSHLTLSKVEVRDKRIAILMLEYHEALPGFDLGTHSRNHNSKTIVGLFSRALGKGESRLRKIWENKGKLLPKHCL
ncbi:MAG: hypothetical protein VX412_04500 [Pseudomonadota bacterium]|nr:hypothetical protein [Pseudomonadota bacterium]